MDKTRLTKLDLTNFALGQDILFCPRCLWQAEIPNMAVADTQCPDCSNFGQATRLHVSRIDKELVDLTEWRRRFIKRCGDSGIDREPFGIPKHVS